MNQPRLNVRPANNSNRTYRSICSNSVNEKEHVEAVVKRIEEANTDVTADYQDWMITAFSLASMGEAGRELFHRVSCLSSKYDYKDCDNKFSNCLLARNGSVGLGSFFELARRNGIDISVPERLKPQRGRPRKGEEKDSVPLATRVIEKLNESYEFRFNEITDLIDYRIKSFDGTASQNWTRLTDRVFRTIVTRIRQSGINVTDNVLTSIIGSQDVTPTYNPIVDYCKSLEEWDRSIDYVEQFFDFIIFESEEERHYCMPLLKKWFINMVALMIGKVDDNQLMPTLIGAQHIGKTYFCEHILPPQLRQYRNTIMPDEKLSNKDTMLGLSETVLWIFDEFCVGKKSNNQIKAIITSTETYLRDAYGHFRQKRKRRASFIGTSNDITYLQQKEGSRRWLTVKITGTKDLNENQLPYEGAYAQAYHIVMNQTPRHYAITKAESAMISEKNAEHVVPDFCEVVIPLFYRTPNFNEEGKMFTFGDIMRTLSFLKSPEINTNNVGKALHNLGITPKRRSDGNRYYLIEIQPTEREMILKQEGHAYYQEIQNSLLAQQAELSARQEAQQQLPFEESSEMEVQL